MFSDIRGLLTILEDFILKHAPTLPLPPRPAIELDSESESTLNRSGKALRHHPLENPRLSISFHCGVATASDCHLDSKWTCRDNYRTTSWMPDIVKEGRTE